VSRGLLRFSGATGWVGRFLTSNRGAALFEFVIDTTTLGARPAPVLNLWAWQATPQKLAAGFAAAQANDDWGFFYDQLEELQSDTFGIVCTDEYPDWPVDVDAGDRAVMRALRAELSAAKGLRRGARALFHHVDVWPGVDLLTGQPFSVAKNQLS